MNFLVLIAVKKSAIIERFRRVTVVRVSVEKGMLYIPISMIR
jgi:hypothetical protein